MECYASRNDMEVFWLSPYHFHWKKLSHVLSEFVLGTGTKNQTYFSVCLLRVQCARSRGKEETTVRWSQSASLVTHNLRLLACEDVWRLMKIEFAMQHMLTFWETIILLVLYRYVRYLS